LANLSDDSYLLRGSLSVSVPNLVPFTLATSYSGGGPGKEFTIFRADGAVTVDLQFQFELYAALEAGAFRSRPLHAGRPAGARPAIAAASPG